MAGWLTCLFITLFEFLSISILSSVFFSRAHFSRSLCSMALWHGCFSTHTTSSQLQYPFFSVNTLTNFRVYLIHFSVSWWHTTFTAVRANSLFFVLLLIVRLCNWCGIDSSSTHTKHIHIHLCENRKIEHGVDEVKRCRSDDLTLSHFLRFIFQKPKIVRTNLIK